MSDLSRAQSKGPCTVIVAAPELLDALRQHVGNDAEIISFTDSESLKALDAISMRHPRVITLERLFAATSRGAALINRIKADPSLMDVEIRVMSHDGTHSRVSPRRIGPRQAVSAGDSHIAVEGEIAGQLTAPPNLDFRGTRRAPRSRMSEGTELQVDGAVAELINLSTIGAQIISATPLKPQQRVRVVLADERGVVRFNAAVAWASLEIPKGVSRYRAGLEFTDADAKAVDDFCARHRA